MSDYNVELRKRVGAAFPDRYLPITIPENVEGLLSNGKLSEDLMPSFVMSGMRFAGTLSVGGAVKTTLEDSAGGFIDDNKYEGQYFIATADITLTASTGWTCAAPGDEGDYIFPISIEAGDWVILKSVNADGSLVEIAILDNDFELATTSKAGLMSSSDKSKLDGIAASANNYSHPTQSAISVDTTGAEVIDQLVVNTNGHVTTATKRTMTLANLGYTGAVDANKYVHPTINGYKHIPQNGVANDFLAYSAAGTAAWVAGLTAFNRNFGTGSNEVAMGNHKHSEFDRNVAALTGANVISLINVTDGIVTSVGTRALTPADIGAAVDHSHPYDNYQGWTLLADSANGEVVSSQVDVDFIAGEGIDLTVGSGVDSVSLTIASEVASISNKGVAELATVTEAIAGSDGERVVTPAGLGAALAYHYGMPVYESIGIANTAADNNEISVGSMAMVKV